jgi:hypothetical protein
MAGIIDRLTPHGSLNDRSEVVVHERDIDGRHLVVIQVGFAESTARRASPSSGLESKR